MRPPMNHAGQSRNQAGKSMDDDQDPAMEVAGGAICRSARPHTDSPSIAGLQSKLTRGTRSQARGHQDYRGATGGKCASARRSVSAIAARQSDRGTGSGSVVHEGECMEETLSIDPG